MSRLMRSLALRLSPICRTLLFFILCGISSYSTALGGFYLKNWQTSPEETKLTYVRVLMEQSQRYNISFNESAEFYRDRINELATTVLAQKKHAFEKVPLATHFASVAVMHCDWKNDFEKLEFAEKYLGETKMQLYGEIFPKALIELRKNCPNSAVPSSPNASTSTAPIDELATHAE